MIDQAIEQQISSSVRTSARELSTYNNLVKIRVEITNGKLEASDEAVTKLDAEIARLEAVKYETPTEEP